MLLGPLYKKLIEKPYPRIDLRNAPFFPIIKEFSVEMYRAAFEYSQYLPETVMQEIQERRIMALVRRAKKMIPFYARYVNGVNTVHDLRKLPPVSKKEMREAFDRGECINESLLYFGIPQQTSGSTGIPFRFFLDANMLSRRRAIYRRLIEWSGKTDSDIVVNLMPRIHPGLEKECLFINCNDPAELEQNLEAFFNFCKDRSIILQSRPSYLLRLAQLLDGSTRKPHFKSFISYTEQLIPEIRAYIENVFGAPVFDYYGSYEITAIAQECEIHEGLHVNCEWVNVEILDNANNAVKFNEVGDIVLTSLDNEVMPFIRYKIGDQGYWLEKLCACGRTLPRIVVEGRSVNSFLLPNGRLGYFATLIHPIAILVSKIRQYQVIRKSRNEFEIKIVPTEIFEKSDEQFIMNRFKRYIGQNTKIQLNIVPGIKIIPGHKHRAFVNLVPDYL